MKFKIYYIILSAVFTVLSLFSCSDEYVKGTYIASSNEYSLNMGTSDLQNIPSTGGVIKTRIEATSAVNWEIQGLPLWLSTTTLSGKGSQDVLFNAEANESFTSSRTHIFNIVSDNADWNVTIPVSATQIKKAKELSVSPSDNSSLTFDSKGGQKTLSITSNLAWNAECAEDFVHLSQTSAAQDAKIVITVESYDQIDITQNRTSSIYFKDANEGDVLSIIKITQTPLQTSISTENISVEFDQNKNSKVYSLGKISGKYSVSSDASWLSIVKNKETESVDVTISVAANDNDDERTSKAYVYLEASNAVLYSFSVRQKGNLIEIQPTSLSYTADGGTYSVDVNTDSRWAASTQDDWIKLQESGTSCRIAVAENNSLQARTGSVQFYRTNGNNEAVGRTVALSVAQEARHITPDMQTLQFSPEASNKTLHISTDAAWTLSTDESWISLSAESGIGDKDINVYVTENTTSLSRTGILRLVCLDKTIEIHIIQNSAYLNTGSNSISFEPLGGEASLSFTSNISWKLTSSASWLTCSEYYGSGDANIVLKASNNDTQSDRSATVVISSMLGDYILSVTQKAHSITLSNSYLTFTQASGKKTVSVKSTYGTFTSSASDSWITITQGSTYTGNSITVQVDANSSLKSRQGSVIIKSGNISKTIIVYQDPAESPVVTITSAGAVNWSPYVKAKVKSNGASISKCGVIMKYSNSYTAPSFTIDSNDAIKYGTLNSDGTFEVTFGQYDGYWFYYFKAFVITSEGDVIYSDVSDGIRT